MSKLSGGKRILTEDFSGDEQHLIRKLSFILNPFMEQVFNAFQKRITIADNLDMEFKDVEVVVDGSGNITNTASFQTNRGKINGLLVVYAAAVNSTATITASPFVTWRQDNNVIEIQHVTGLPVDTRFKLRLLILGS